MLAPCSWFKSVGDRSWRAHGAGANKHIWGEPPAAVASRVKVSGEESGWSFVKLRTLRCLTYYLFFCVWHAYFTRFCCGTVLPFRHEGMALELWSKSRGHLMGSSCNSDP